MQASNVIALSERVSQEIRDTANDINAYLSDPSVPMECYQKDIDAKLVQMKVNVVTLILREAGVPVVVTNGPQPTV